MSRLRLFSALIFLGLGPLAARAQSGGGMPGMNMPGMDMPGMTMPLTTPATTAIAPVGPIPVIVVAPRMEEGNRMIGATVTLNGQPLDGARVNFFVERSFGALDLGHDDTYVSDGAAVAAVKFPEGLPGGTTGKLHIIARVVAKPPPATPFYAAGAGDTMLPADIIVVPDPDPFPRALWAPHAPIPLILTLALALGGVWTTYIFVLTQLRALRKEGLS